MADADSDSEADSDVGSDAFETTDVMRCTVVSDGRRGVFFVCVGENGLDGKQCTGTHSVAESLVNMNVNGSYMDWMHYQQLKYALAMRWGEAEAEAQNHVMAEHYHVAVSELAFDMDSNHLRQCWSGSEGEGENEGIARFPFRVCLEADERDGVLSVDKPDIVFDAYSFSFARDTDWDEVTQHRQHQDEDEEEAEEVLIKCAHAFEAKLCVKRISDMQNFIVAYRVSVSINREDLRIGDSAF